MPNLSQTKAAASSFKAVEVLINLSNAEKVDSFWMGFPSWTCFPSTSSMILKSS